MFFSSGLKQRFNRFFATHPPLHERIHRISPGFLSEYPQENTQEEPHPTFTEAISTTGSHNFANNQLEAKASTVNQSGEITPYAISKAQQKIQAVATPLLEASQNIFTARAIIYGLILHAAPTIDRKQLTQYLSEKAHPAVFKKLQQISLETENLPPDKQWVLLLKSLPTLRRLSSNQQKVFLANLKFVIEQDKKISIVEWCIFTLIKQAFKPNNYSGQSLSIKRLSHDISVVLSFIHYQNGNHALSEEKFFSATEKISAVKLLPTTEVSFNTVATSLTRLKKLAPLSKPKFLKAAIKIAYADQELSPNETLFINTLALYLDTPTPAIENILGLCNAT